MKPHYKASANKTKNDIRIILIVGISILLLQVIFHVTLAAQFPTRNPLAQNTIKNELQKQLNSDKLLKKLNFPNTVKRFYALNGFEANWLRSEENSSPTVSAMLLLDCVKQYGLQHITYHPRILNYETLHKILTNTSNITIGQKIEFELMLTDAMISMINHLHFGAYNPIYNNDAIDHGITNRLKAEEFLRKATNSKNLMDTILTVQPKSEQYRQLQGYMKLITGQYICDSYETPDEEVRKIAINLERLRWVNVEKENYLHINIPSFDLIYQLPDTTYQFKVVIGKPATPTPTLQSSVYLIESAPDWNVPNKIFIKELLPNAINDNSFFENNHMAVYDASENIITINANTIAQIKANPKSYHLRQSAGCDNALGKVVFRFINSGGIYLHDTPDQPFFKLQQRALSHGCIRVENSGKLAELLLAQDHQQQKIASLNVAMNTYSKKQFRLSSPVPIIITYLTYGVRDGLLVSYDDIYYLDAALEQKMYGQLEQLTKN